MTTNPFAAAEFVPNQRTLMEMHSEPPMNDIAALMLEVLDYWVDREDVVDGNDGRQEANEAMTFVQQYEKRMRASIAILNLPPYTPQQHDAPGSGAQTGREDFCWLVELFGPGGNSMGIYHTGFSTLSRGSRSTANPYEAKRYLTRESAQMVADALLSKSGTWKAIEHGFAAASLLSRKDLIAERETLLAALIELVARCDGEEGVRADGSNIQTIRAHAAIAKAEAA